MSEFLNVTLLALLQGVAEFLPISSSGHLVIGQHLLGMKDAGLQLDVFLHGGTLLSVFVFYRKTILRILVERDWEFLAKIVLSALPAVLVYFVFRKKIDALFENAKMVGALLMFTGVVLSGTRLLPKGDKAVSFWRALWMGAMQAVALLPGVSRSGMTLASARGGRVAPEAAAEFSFRMSTPLIIGAAFLEALKAFGGSAAEVASSVPEPSWGLVSYGAVVAAVTGYFSLAWLVKVLKGRWFWAFGPYCIVVGLLTICL
jgi:undecaprenyl-diphosphatase